MHIQGVHWESLLSQYFHIFRKGNFLSLCCTWITAIGSQRTNKRVCLSWSYLQRSYLQILWQRPYLAFIIHIYNPLQTSSNMNYIFGSAGSSKYPTAFLFKSSSVKSFACWAFALCARMTRIKPLVRCCYGSRKVAPSLLWDSQYQFSYCNQVANACRCKALAQLHLGRLSSRVAWIGSSSGLRQRYEFRAATARRMWWRQDGKGLIGSWGRRLSMVESCTVQLRFSWDI